MLFEKFRSFVQDKKLLPSNGKILLAVSGGIDSSVMMHLFYRLQVTCEVAHCNFQLRGQESDKDEIFVRALAAEYQFPFYVARFETTGYADERKLSIQMAARELRYSWFYKLAGAHHCERIAIAHNRDDAMETFFINLGRGSGIAGLTGMRTHSEAIIRPLLFASRMEIEQYSKEYRIAFREDASNAHDKYLRNYIRHHILPAFDEINPQFRDSMTGNMEKLSDAYLLYQYALEHIIPGLIRQEEDLVFVDIPKLISTPAPKTILFEILKQYGFTASASEEIYHMHESESGRQFLNSSFKIIKDRTSLIISPIRTDGPDKYYIDEGTQSIALPLQLSFQIETGNPDFRKTDLSVAYLDYEKLVFPLIIRRWRKGDYFRPLGMNGLKKVSDFFIDSKMSLIDKEKTWLLLSADEIVWIIGKRIDDRFKITSATKKILKINML